MNKVAIIYISTHHKNTEKVVKAMAEEIDIDIIAMKDINNFDIENYDIIGFASGIYFSSFNKALKKLIEDTSFRKQQKVFLVYTCGINCINYAKSVEKILKNKSVDYLGCFSCNGFDTYGIFGKLGGIKKGRPNEKDLNKARNFINKIIQSIQKN